MGYGVLPGTGVYKKCGGGTWGDTDACVRLTVTDDPRAFLGRVACMRRSPFQIDELLLGAL